MLNQVVHVFDFLSIKYPNNSQKKVLYFLPLAVSVLLTIALVMLLMLGNDDANLLLNDRFDDLFTLLAILPGFYIASLSAVAAINKPAIDENIDGESAPYLIKNNKDHVGTYNQPLTRRVFLSMLFSYLAAIILLLTLLLTALRFIFSLDLFKGFLVLSQRDSLNYVIFILTNIPVFFAITQLILLTLIGVNYLGYKALVNE